MLRIARGVLQHGYGDESTAGRVALWVHAKVIGTKAISAVFIKYLRAVVREGLISLALRFDETSSFRSIRYNFPTSISVVRLSIKRSLPSAPSNGHCKCVESLRSCSYFPALSRLTRSARKPPPAQRPERPSATPRGSARLKNARRLATRYDKTAASYLGFVHIVSCRLWLKHFVNKT